MIIECINCNKKFNVNSNDIPEKGRLLLCTNCNHKWFFKKETINMPIKTTKIIEPINETTVFNEEFKPSDNENSKTIALLDKKNVDDFPTGNILINNKDQKIEISNENYNILNLTIIFIISFVAIIILLDTFKYPISKIVPDIELILYNLYETINDIKLFLIDLI
jgi:predicted Zn finger-like uncharacterized protein